MQYNKKAEAKKELERLSWVEENCRNGRKKEMLLIKGNRLVSSNVSFDFPEKFSIVFNNKLYCENMIRFVSRTGIIKYGTVNIEVSLRYANESAVKDLRQFIGYGGHLRSEIKPIVRGDGTGYCAYYNACQKTIDMYAEKYDFPMTKQGINRFDLCVFLMAGKGKKLVQNVEGGMDIPIVKKFLDSIRYK